MKTKIGIMVEGETEKILIEKMLSVFPDIEIKFYIAAGKYPFVSRAGYIRALLLDDGAEAVVLIFDADTWDRVSAYEQEIHIGEELNRFDPNNTLVVAIVPVLEILFFKAKKMYSKLQAMFDIDITYEQLRKHDIVLEETLHKEASRKAIVDFVQEVDFTKEDWAKLISEDKTFKRIDDFIKNITKTRSRELERETV